MEKISSFHKKFVIFFLKNKTFSEKTFTFSSKDNELFLDKECVFILPGSVAKSFL